MNALELEQHIKDLGRLMFHAYINNQPQLAREWLRLQTQAIKARPALTVQRMEIERGLA